MNVGNEIQSGQTLFTMVDCGLIFLSEHVVAWSVGDELPTVHHESSVFVLLFLNSSKISFRYNIDTHMTLLSASTYKICPSGKRINMLNIHNLYKLLLL